MDLKKHKIKIYEPFSDFLLGEDAEKNFELSLLDVVRFAGHACPSMVGAFLVAQRAVQELYPETGVCVRGQIRIFLPNEAQQGPAGPIANVFGFITGAWGETGFGGLRGEQYVRRHLLKFGEKQVPQGCFLFQRIDNNARVLLQLDSGRAQVDIDPQLSFQKQWRKKIEAMLGQDHEVVRVV